MIRNLLGVVGRSKTHCTRRKYYTNYEQPRAIYAGYRIYKGKASLAFNSIPPTFRKLPSTQDNGQHALTIDRPGVMLLEFVPSMGERQFDYNRKQVFALSAGEIGEIVAKTAAGKSCSLIHDPSKFKGNMVDMTTSNNRDNTDMKRVNIDPMDRKDGFFISFNSDNTKISVPITTGEFVVVRQLLLTAIPHLLGFEASWNLTNMEPKEQNSGYGGGGGGGGGYGGRGGNSDGAKVGDSHYGGSTLGNSSSKQVFNPFDNQTGSSNATKSSGSSSSTSSNWLDEL
jgi:hypothetical protein